MIRLENPWTLALPLLGLIVLLWRRYRRQDNARRTVYLELWEKAAAGVKIWEKWRVPLQEWRLLLLWLACFAGALAAAGPSWVGRGGARYRLILDRSASMSALTSEGKTRFDEARAGVAAFLAERGMGDRVSLWVLGDRMEPLVAETERLDSVRAALEGILPLPESENSQALEASMLHASENLVTIFFSDSPGRNVETILWGVGDPIANAGFVAASAQGTWPKSAIRLRGEIRNFASAAQSRAVVLSGSGRATQRLEFSPTPGATQEFEFSFDRAPGGRIRLSLEPPDAFPADDTLFFELASPPQAPLVLLSASTPDAVSPLEAAAAALSEEYDFSLQRVADLAAVPADAVLLAEGGRFEILPSARGGAILFGTQIPGLLGEPRLLQPKVTDWKREHPILRGLSFDFLACTQAWSGLGEAEPLVSSSEGPLLVGVQKGEARIVASAFRLADSNLPVQANFPLLLRRAYAWILGNPEDGVPALSWTGGQPAFLDASESTLENVPPRGPSKVIPQGPGFARDFLGSCVILAAIFLGLLLLLELRATFSAGARNLESQASKP